MTIAATSRASAPEPPRGRGRRPRALRGGTVRPSPPPTESRLPDDEQQAWGVLVTVLASLPSALEAPLRRAADLSLFEFQILDALATTAGRSMRLSDLAHATNASLSRLSRAADRLQARGAVQRVIDGSDGRYTLCRLTDAGEHTVAAAVPGHVDQVRRLIFDQLSGDDVDHLTRIASRISGAVRAEHDRVPRSWAVEA